MSGTATELNQKPSPQRRPFGQSEPLTRRLHNLVRKYPKGVGIFKEFIQNADDAGATQVNILMDWQSCAAEKILAPTMARLAGPSLLISNDALFTAADLQNIQEIGYGGKLQAGFKTGRFGLGFNACYNVTDYPSLLTGNSLAFFDPHHDTVPGATAGEPGGLWELNADLWTHSPDVIQPFQRMGLQPGSTRYDGTIFRLPLRTADQAARSEICREPFNRDHFEEMVEQLCEVAPELLLFLRHVLSIRVTEIGPDKHACDLLRVATVNADDVQRHRDVVNEALAGDHAQVLAKIQQGGASVSYQHHVQVASNHGSVDHVWQIVGGLYADPKGCLLGAAQEMFSHDEKAFPWAGAAARLQTTGDALTVADERANGRVFCTLPVSGPTGLPLHLNGCFDLDDSRQNLTVNEGSLTGKDACRARWNQVLVQHGVARAYADLLESMKNSTPEERAGSFYALWPTTGASPVGLTSLATEVFRHLAPRQVVRTSHIASDPWARPDQVSVLPFKAIDLQDPLVADGALIPHPKLPDRIVAEFERAGTRLKSLTPAALRNMLRQKDDVNARLSEAPRPCLRKKEWVTSLLRYSIDDDKPGELAGLPLALTADGNLHTFARTPGHLFLGEADAREVFATETHWFIDAQLALDTNMQPNEAAKIADMHAGNVVVNLKFILGENAAAPRPWQPRDLPLPNDSWLTLVYQYLTKHVTVWSKQHRENVKKLPIVPDQHGQLHLPAAAATPLLEGSRPQLTQDVVDAFQIPVVAGSRELVSAIESFARAVPDMIWFVTGPDLVDTLGAILPTLPTEPPPATPEICGRLLEFLAEERWFQRYQEGDAKRAKALRRMPIFPTSGGSLVAIDANVFIPDRNCNPPSVAADTTVLRTGANDRWWALLALLGAETLNRATLIQKVLLPQFDALEPPKQLEVLRWTRDNLRIAQTELEQKDPDAAASLLASVAAARLIRCTDGQLRSAREVYEPGLAVIVDLLGEQASHPDMSVYRPGESSWLEFFRELGMASQPRPLDVLSYVDRLVASSTAQGATAVAERAAALFRFLDDNWSHFAGVLVEDGRGASVSFDEALASKAWIPAQRDAKSLAYAGAVVPPDRLYAAHELYLPRMAHLVASQAPIAAVRQPRAEFQDAMGFPKTPPVTLVANHLASIVDLWQSRSARAGVTEKAIRQSITQIYRFFGTLIADTSDDDDAGQSALVADGNVAALRDAFRGKPCLWEAYRKTFLPPERVFREAPRFLEPWCIAIAEKDPYDAGYEALGRRASVDAEVLTLVLGELALKHGGKSLPEKEARQVREILSLLALKLPEGANPVPGVYVLTSKWLLVPASSALLDDAPWYSQRLGSSHLPLVSQSDIPVDLARRTGVRRLSEVVRETVATAPIPSTDDELLEDCARWEDTLRTAEFRHGLLRLIRQRWPDQTAEDATWLGRVRVSAVDAIVCELWLNTEEGKTKVGTAASDHYFDPDSCTIFLSRGEDLALSFLAEAINRQLAPQQLENLSPLEKIIDSAPEDIDGLLTRLRVPLNRAFEPAAEGDADQDRASSGLDDGIGAEPTDEVLPNEDGDGIGSGTSNAAAPHDEQVDQDDEFEGGDGDEPNDGEGEHPQTGRSRDAGQASSTSQHTGNRRHRRPGESSDGEDDASTPMPQPSDGGTEESPGHAGNGHGTRTRTGLGDSPSPDPNAPPRPQRRQKQRRQRQSRRAVTYLIAPKDAAEVRSDRADDEQPQNMKVSEAGVRHVLAWELRHRPYAKSMPHNNPGYDVESGASKTAIERYIEVKSIDGPWDDSGVPLTPRQFTTARRLNKQFWLYVVEHALDDTRVRLHRIQNPADLVTQFRFDRGWESLAEPVPSSPTNQPVAGGAIDVPGKGTGTIISVKGNGAIKLVHARFHERNTEEFVFQPQTMTCRPPK